MLLHPAFINKKDLCSSLTEYFSLLSTGYAYMNTGYKFEQQWKANASFSYSARAVNLQGKSGEFYYMSFSGSKEIVKIS
jgi:hypothetical protein